MPVLEPNDIEAMPAGTYLICMALIWKNRQGENRGTSKHLEITVCDTVLFDRVEESNQLLPLSDPGRFGDYWHKVWEGSFTEDRKRFEFKIKYYTVTGCDTIPPRPDRNKNEDHLDRRPESKRAHEVGHGV